MPKKPGFGGSRSAKGGRTAGGMGANSVYSVKFNSRAEYQRWNKADLQNAILDAGGSMDLAMAASEVLQNAEAYGIKPVFVNVFVRGNNIRVRVTQSNNPTNFSLARVREMGKAHTAQESSRGRGMTGVLGNRSLKVREYRGKNSYTITISGRKGGEEGGMAEMFAGDIAALTGQ